MDRRTFLKTSTLLPAMATVASSWPRLARPASAQQKPFEPRPGMWRTFELTTRIEVQKASGPTRVWVPVPAVESSFQHGLGDRWAGNASTAQLWADEKYGARLVHAEFPAGESAPVLEVISRFQTQNRGIDWSRTGAPADAGAARWTAPSDLIPTDGIVRDTAVEITRGRSTEREKVQAIYDWILANLYREPKVRGCGVGDIKVILETRNFGGKCADINALFVGLNRSVGIPARDVYGIRVAPSAFGYKALGAGSANVTKAQHCRAEVYLQGHGWVAMDPADVTKVAREETSEWLKIDHPIVEGVRPKLFGAWEGNWVGYNTAHDVALPGSTDGGRLGFLMYPQAETASSRLDCLDPDNFKYTITSREIAA